MSSQERMPGLIAVVISYRNYTDTAECLRPLSASTLLVDNGSDDGSGERLGREFDWVRLVRRDVNSGYAPGANLGLSRAMEEGGPTRPVPEQRHHSGAGHGR